MLIKGKLKKDYGGKEISGYIKKMESIQDSGGIYWVIETDKGLIESWKIDYLLIGYNVDAMDENVKKFFNS